MKNNLKDKLFHLFVNIFIKKRLQVNNQVLKEYAKANRLVSNGVDDWIADSVFKNSVFNYGIPDVIKDRINLKINDEVNYTDLFLYLASRFELVNYLEIGVSVGKNFLPVINNMDAYKITGLDIETINPLIESKLDLISETQWKTKIDSIKAEDSYCRNYKYEDKNVVYISGDVYDKKSWEMLKGNKFNVIFSDALHTPEAIYFEMESLLKYDLIADEFVIIWDDIETHMEYSFWRIYKLLRSKYNLKLKNVSISKINGWLGEHEKKHSIGMISNIKLEN